MSMTSASSSLRVRRKTFRTVSDCDPILDDVSESASVTSCCWAWWRAALRVRIRLPAPAMTRTTATSPTMASVKRRRMGQPNR